MEWADLTEEHTSRLLDTNTLLSPEAIGEAVLMVAETPEGDPSALDARSTGDGELSPAD